MTVSEQIAQAFQEWEEPLRGWRVYTLPISLRIPQIPIGAYLPPAQVVIDDGRQETLLSGFVSRFAGNTDNSSDWVPPESNFADKTELDAPKLFEKPNEPFISFQIACPEDYRGSLTTYRNLIQSLRYVTTPISFEVVGNDSEIGVQIGTWRSGANGLLEQLHAHFPDATITPSERELLPRETSESEFFVDFGLEYSALSPITCLSDLNHDPLRAMIGALEGLQSGESAVFQLILSQLDASWTHFLCDQLTGVDGSSLFEGVDSERMAQEKASAMLFGTVLRIGVSTPSDSKSRQIARDLAGALSQFDAPGKNNLMPLSNDYYFDTDHRSDIQSRMSRRGAMLLNLDELVGLLHFPDAVVRSARLVRQRMKTKQAPGITTGHPLSLGVNSHRGLDQEVTLDIEQRLRHMHLIGASGTGKSTLMLQMIKQDLEQGNGIAVLDPHGELIDKVLSYVPDDRMENVILFDPADDQFPVAFNILDAHSELEKTLLESDLVSVFRRLSTSWGDQMNSVLANGIIAMLEHKEGGTLPLLRRFLVDKAYRTEFLKGVQDEEIIYYWEKEFPMLSGKPQAPVLTRLDTFLRPKPIRYMVSQRENKIDFSSLMQGKKILLAKLSQGAIGQENSYLLGAFLISKLNQMAFSRQEHDPDARNPFFVYIDEFHNFITPSMEQILSGTRKYGVSLVLAHQDLQQLSGRDADVAASVRSNPHTKICFRLGDADAKKLQGDFSYFEAIDLQSLSIGEAIGRVEKSAFDFNLKVPQIEAPPADAGHRLNLIIERSRAKYGTPRDIVEKKIKGSQQVGERNSSLEEKNTSGLVSADSNQSDEKLPGRGGKKHKEMQAEIKKIGQDVGFRAIVERSLGKGKGHVDVALERENLRIAVEISVTSPIEHELKNIQKCLDAGFQQVVWICDAPKRRKDMELEIQSFEKDEEKKILISSLAGINEYLKRYQDSNARTMGYRISVFYP